MPTRPNKGGKGPPKVSEQPRERPGFNLNVWLNDLLGEAFERSRKKIKRTKTAHIEAILEEFLSRDGEWPPPSPLSK